MRRHHWRSRARWHSQNSLHALFPALFSALFPALFAKFVFAATVEDTFSLHLHRCFL
jgi:hypothetical protein